MANNAKEKIQRVLKIIQDKDKTGLLYAAIDELLPPDYDKEYLFERFQIRKNDYHQTSIEKEIISDTLAVIGLHFSQKSDEELSKIKKKMANNYDGKMALLPKMMRSFLDYLKYVSYNDINIIFDHFGISNNKDIMDDGDSVTSFKRTYKLDLNDKFILIERDNFGYIAFVFIGVAVISGFLKYPKKYTEEKEDIIDKTPEPDAKPEDISHSDPVNIVMLILPANKIDDITEGEAVDLDTAIRMIDGSIYFGCFPQDEAKNIESELDLKDKEFSRDTAQDIYISLEVKNGQKLIQGASLKFSLKKRLRNKPREFTILKIRLLEKLQGLEKLNRI